MYTFLTKWFTGSRFWTLLGFISLISVVAHLFFPFMSAILVAQHSIVMWVAFATAEILRAIEGDTSYGYKSDNA